MKVTKVVSLLTANDEYNMGGGVCLMTVAAGNPTSHYSRRKLKLDAVISRLVVRIFTNQCKLFLETQSDVNMAAFPNTQKLRQLPDKPS